MTARRKEDVLNFIETLAREQYKDYRLRHFIRVNAQYNLEDVAGDPIKEPIRQMHTDMTHFGGVQGCFQNTLTDEGVRRYTAGEQPDGTANDDVVISNKNARDHYGHQTFLASQYAADFFGETMSVAYETQIAINLAANINTAFISNDTRFTNWLQGFSASSLDPTDNSIMVQVQTGMMTPESTRTITSADDPFMFNALNTTITLSSPGIISTPWSIVFTIARGFKGVLTMTGDNGTTETISNNVKNTYTLASTTWNSEAAKVGTNPRARLVLSREDAP